MALSHVTAAVRLAAVAVILMLPMAAKAADGAYYKRDAGPSIGATIPHTLKASDQNGKPQDFAALKGNRGLILLFSRSLGW